MPKLPYIDLVNFKGLFTKSSPDVLQAEQLRIAENCDFFETYGAISKIKGNSRVLTTQYPNSTDPEKIPWISFYKATDLDGRILRHTLVAAGSILARIDSGSLTTLKGNRTPDLFHSSTLFDRFMFITNQNPDLVGEGDDLVKYDGAVISNWGIKAPGTEETILEHFADADSFDAKPSKVLVTDDILTTFDGEAIRIDKTFTDAGKIFYVEKNFYTGFYISSDNRDTSKSAGSRISFFTYIPRGQLTADCINLSSFSDKEAAMAVWFSPDRDSILNNYWQFYIPIGQLLEGWNQISPNLHGKPDLKAGNFYPEVDQVNRFRIDFRLTRDADTKTGIRLDRFLRLDEGTPIVNSSGTGSLTGAYQYKVTFISKYGHESNAGPASATHTVSSVAQLDLTKVPVSEDPQVIARQIYRTVAGGSVFLFLDRIDNNSRTDYTDTFADGSLGNATPPQAGDFSDDNSPPPKGGIVKTWKDTVWVAGDPQNPRSLFFSDSNEPESFPLINEFQLDDKITAMYETYSSFIVETETGKWQVLGDNPDFSVDKMVNNMGCVGRRAAGQTRLIGYAVDRDGLRLFDGNNAMKISEPIRDKYDDLSKVNIELVHTAHSMNRNMILQFNPDTTTPIPEYDSIFAFIYSIDDPNQGYWTTINIPTAVDLNILALTEIEDADGNFRLYASDDSGMVYEMFEPSTLNWTAADGTATAIKTKFQTPYLRPAELGAETHGATGRADPRYIEVRVKNNTAGSLTITIESADGSSQTTARDSVTMTLTYGTNNSTIRQAIPSSFHSGEYLRITVENNVLSEDFEVTGIRLYFHTYPFEGQHISVSTV